MHKKLIYLLSILFLISCNTKPKPHITEKQAQETEKRMVEVNRLMLLKDRKRIEGYIERSGLSMEESPTGLWYLINVWGKGDTIREGNNVTLKYKLSLLDGTECYNSEKDGLKSFNVGRGGVESGLEEAILMLAEGGQAIFILPPHLAHGFPGDGDKIPARAILIYEIEVLRVE